MAYRFEEEDVECEFKREEAKYMEDPIELEKRYMPPTPHMLEAPHVLPQLPGVPQIYTSKEEPFVPIEETFVPTPRIPLPRSAYAPAPILSRATIPTPYRIGILFSSAFIILGILNAVWMPIIGGAGLLATIIAALWELHE